MRDECLARGFAHDIHVEEEARILGSDWYRFLGSARAMLASESGSNVVDPWASFAHNANGSRVWVPCRDEIYDRAVAPYDGKVVMNQIAPKIFEAVRLRTCLVLLEGEWSGVLQPQHYIALRKDWQNIDEVLAAVMDDGLVADNDKSRVCRSDPEWDFLLRSADRAHRRRDRYRTRAAPLRMSRSS